MCCGRTRSISASPRLAAPARGGGVPAGRGALIAYVGRTGLTVRGPVSGATYRFAAAGARLSVDPRDVPALLKVPVLRAG